LAFYFLVMTSSSLFDKAAAARALPRRAFLQVAGASAATASLVLAGCADDTPAPIVSTNYLSLGSADAGLLNYAYLLEQLEAAFYQKVIDTPPADFQAADLAAFNDLRDHEVIHREMLKYAIGTSIIPALTFDFSTISFTTRTSVLAAAKKLEDLGVAAYNGIARLVSDTTTLAILTKISSVEARHAAFVRDLITPGSFATDAVVDDGALLSVGVSKTPTQVVAEAAPYFLPLIVYTDSLPTA
jgi:rubrerythrin